jgi:large subunit ribosomal protein L30
LKAKKETKAIMSEKMITVTQVRSAIGGTKKQKATIKALGLGRPNHRVEIRDNACTRGQIRVVQHLVKVEEN